MIVAKRFPVLGLLLFAAACNTAVAPSYYERAHQLYEGRRLPDAEVAYLLLFRTSGWMVRLDTIDGKAVAARTSTGVAAVLPGRHVLGVRTKSQWAVRGRGKCADLVFRARAGGVYKFVQATARGRRGRLHRVMRIVDQRTGFAVAEAKVRRKGLLEGRGFLRSKCTPRGG